MVSANFLRKGITAFLSTAILVGSVSSVFASSEALKYDYSQNSIEYNAVFNAIKDEEILEEYMRYFSRSKPPMAIARYDLNSDGKQEIIAVLNEDTLFCGNQQICPHIIFTNTRSGLVKIGEFKASAVKVASTRTSGINDLYVYPFSEKNSGIVTYKWAGRAYQPVKR